MPFLRRRLEGRFNATMSAADALLAMHQETALEVAEIIDGYREAGKIRVTVTLPLIGEIPFDIHLPATKEPS